MTRKRILILVGLIAFIIALVLIIRNTGRKNEAAQTGLQSQPSDLKPFSDLPNPTATEPVGLELYNGEWLFMGRFEQPFAGSPYTGGLWVEFQSSDMKRSVTAVCTDDLSQLLPIPEVGAKYWYAPQDGLLKPVDGGHVVQWYYPLELQQ